MRSETFTPNEVELIRHCLAFIATASQLDHEFETRLGLSRSEFAEVIMRWPSRGKLEHLAIHNALNELANGLHLSKQDWQKIGSTQKEIIELHKLWLASNA